SYGFLLYAVQLVSRPPMLLVVPVFLLVVLVHADEWVSTGGCAIPTSRYSFMLIDGFLLVVALFLLDDHNKVAYLEKGKAGKLMSRFWTFSIGRTSGPSEIIATIAGNEVVVTESLIRTQLHLNDAHGLCEFTLHDVLDGMREIRTYNFSRFILDGMIGNIGSKRHKFLMYPRFLQMILVGPAGGDGADAVAAGAAAANKVSPPPPPPTVHPTHTSSSSPGPSTATQDTPVRDPTPVREPTPVRKPTPSLVREPTPFWEPTSDSPRPLSPPPYPRLEKVSPTTSTRPPSPTRQTSFHEDVSKGGGDYISSPKSNEAPPTTAATAAGGAEDSAALTDLSLKLDRCINRVTTLENKLGVTKKVLDGAVLKLVSRVKSTSLGGDTTVEAAYTIYKASQDAHASLDAGHDEDTVPDDTTMPFSRTRTKRRRLGKTVTSLAFEYFQENISAVEDTIPAGDGIPTVAQTIPTGSTPIPSSGGVSAGSSIDPVGQAAAAALSSTIPAADKGKAPMVDDSPPADLLTEQERQLKNPHDYQLREEFAKKIHAEQEVEFARQQEELAQKAQAESVASPAEQGTGLSAQHRRELNAAKIIYTEADWLKLMAKIATSSALSKTTFWPTPTLEAPSAKRARQEVPAVSVPTAPSIVVAVSVPAAPSTAATVSVPAASFIAADVSVSAAPSVHADTEVDADKYRLDDTQTAFEHISTEHTVDESTPSSSRTRRKQIAKKRVNPIVDVADDALIKFDSDSDDDPLPYAPYAGREMVPTPLGSIYAYYDMEGHTKHFTSLYEILYMMEKNDLRKLLGAVDNFYQRHEPDTFDLILWGDLCVLFQSLADEDAHAFWQTVDGWVIYMFVDVSYPLSEATLKRMLKHGLEVLKMLVGGDLTMAEQLVSFIKDALLNAQSAVLFMVTQNWMVITFHVPFWNDQWLVQGGTALDQMLLFHDPAVFGVPAGCSCWHVVPAGRLRSHSRCWVSAGKRSFCCP
nr:hypothetical protein [Tanacetum cinerariifolium]